MKKGTALNISETEFKLWDESRHRSTQYWACQNMMMKTPSGPRPGVDIDQSLVRNLLKR